MEYLVILGYWLVILNKMVIVITVHLYLWPRKYYKIQIDAKINPAVQVEQRPTNTDTTTPCIQDQPLNQPIIDPLIYREQNCYCQQTFFYILSLTHVVSHGRQCTAKPCKDIYMVLVKDFSCTQYANEKSLAQVYSRYSVNV